MYKTRIPTSIPALLALVTLSPAWAQTKQDEAANTVNKYVTDITGGTVSASSIIGLNKTAIQQVETSQDLVAALQPMTSGNLKSGFGLAITPARTSLMPMSARKYREDNFYRFLSGITLSFGQNSKDIGGSNYKQTGFSADANYYLKPAQDPIIIAHQAYSDCRGPTEAAMEQLNQDYNEGKISEEEFNKKNRLLQEARNKEYKSCVDLAQKEATQSDWNAGRVNISLGGGTIKASSGDSHSLGKMLTINGLYPVGSSGAVQVSLRTVTDAVDTSSLATTPSFKKGSLIAARYTFGSSAKADDPLPVRAHIEASNAKDSSPVILKDVFLYAVGLDYRIQKGIWLEFRVGRNRTQDGGKKETSGLLTLNITPSTTLFAAK